VLATWNEPSGSELFWADGRTLEPVDDRSYPVPFFFGAAERSPDGTKLAVAVGTTLASSVSTHITEATARHHETGSSPPQRSPARGRCRQNETIAL
jgi:hypothetical protein